MGPATTGKSRQAQPNGSTRPSTPRTGAGSFRCPSGTDGAAEAVATVIDMVLWVGCRAARCREVAARGGVFVVVRGVSVVVRALIGLLIVIAVVLFLVKVAVAGGVIGAIALILLVLVVLRVL